MAISGTTSSLLTAYSSNQLRQPEKTKSLDINLNDDNSSNRKAAEFIFRGELLNAANENNSSRVKKDQTIDPANRAAINIYENNSISTDSILFNQQGTILDAFV